jgi:hypothetical protein
VSFSDEERAELIVALSRTAEMVGLLLDALDVLLVSYVAGQQPSAGDVDASPNTRRNGGSNSRSSAHGWRA